MKLQRQDGSALDVSLNVSAARDEKGGIIFSRSVLRDITEQKHSELQILKAHSEISRSLHGGTGEKGCKRLEKCW